MTLKEAQLALEISQHQITKEALEKAKKEVKKKSVLSLEMEDYERSMKDLTNKMEDDKKKIIQVTHLHCILFLFILRCLFFLLEIIIFTDSFYS